MPEAMERKLKSQARKKGFKGKRAAKYVYGTMSKMGWRKGMSEKEAKAHMRKKALLGR